MKVLLILIIALMFGGCATKYITVQPSVQANYFRRMAVIPFSSGSYNRSKVGVDIADGIQTRLAENIPQMELVERSRLDAILQEHRLIRRGIVDLKTAVTIGKLCGAKVIMTGQIKNINVVRARNMMYGSLRVSVRVIDVERGLIKWATEVKVSHPGPWGRHSAYNRYTGRDEFKADMIEIATIQIAQKFYTHKEKV